jgi:hypothetical protein
MKRRRLPTLPVLLAAVAILVTAPLLSVLVTPLHVALADKGEGNDNGKGNGNSGNGNSGNGNSGGSGNSGSDKSDGGGDSEGGGNDSDDHDSGSDGDDHGGDGSDSGSDSDQDKADDGDAPTAPGGPAADDHHAGGPDRRVQNEIVVADATEGLTDFAQAQGFKVLRSESLDALGLAVTRLRAPDNLSAGQARDLIRNRFPDAIVDFNHLYEPQTSLSLPAPDYASKAVRWSPQLRDCQVGLRLGLIDTAVDWSLPILRGARKEAASFVEEGIAVAPVDHGTGIATLLVGQQGFGLLPGAELYSAGIFAVDGAGQPVASATSFASALNWLLTNKVSTINVSLSGPPDRLMELAVKRARQRGAELVAAVGNDGMTDQARFPAAYDGVIGVTAVDQDGRVFDAANRGDFVALSAPGVALFIPEQPDGSGRLVTGTSFAAPYVTAALARFGNDPDRMFAAALDLGAPGTDPVFGHGLVQGPTACAAAAKD